MASEGSSGAVPAVDSPVVAPGKLAQRIGAGLGARASSWLAGVRKAEPDAKTFAPPPRPKNGEPISCMRVEAQDVMMIETVKERHFDRLRNLVKKETQQPLSAEQ